MGNKKKRLYTKKEVKAIAKRAVGLWRNEWDRNLYQGKAYFGEWFKRILKEYS